MFTSEQLPALRRKIRAQAEVEARVLDELGRRHREERTALGRLMDDLGARRLSDLSSLMDLGNASPIRAPGPRLPLERRLPAEPKDDEVRGEESSGNTPTDARRRTSGRCTSCASDPSGILLWTADLFTWQKQDAQAIFCHLQADVTIDFPVPFYPFSVSGSHEYLSNALAFLRWYPAWTEGLP